MAGDMMKKIASFWLGFLLAWACSSHAATFPYFSPATGVLKGSSTSYITTPAISSDIYGLWSGTCNSGTFLGGDGTCRAATGNAANPTASVGLTTVNGAATTYMRSDAAPALDVSISPTWTGTHIFNNPNTLTLGAAYVDQSTPTAPSSGRIRLYSLNSGSSAQSQLTAIDPNGVTLSVGFEDHMVVYNGSGSTIAVGQLVYICGSHSATPSICLAKADSATTLPAVGFTQYAIANGAYGQVHVSGTVAATTTGFADGDPLYVSPSVAGALTNVAPSAAGQYVQQVGVTTNGGVGAGAGRLQFLFNTPTQAVRSAATGGTGIASYTTGDILYASGSTTLSKLADVATGQYLKSGGVGVAPAYGTIAAGDISGLSVTWTGTEIFNGTPTTGVGVAGVSIGSSSSHGDVRLVDTTGGSNAKMWQTLTSATTLTSRLVNDAFSSTSNITVWTRSGLTLTDMAFGNSTDNNTFTFNGSGLITTTGVKSGGTKFTATGCSNSTTVGGATAGKFTSGTTGTCTVAITLPTAANGWSCAASNITAGTTMAQSASSTTGCTVTGATTSGDIVSFLAIGY